MSQKSLLEGKTILVVDDEPDVLESVGEILDVAIVHKAADYDTALQYLLGYTYDFVILDIMGVNGFELLRESVDRGFPTVMLTAHALTPAALKQSIKLGAVSFLPKEQMGELKTYLEEELEGKKQIWPRIYARLVSHFNSRFGPGWREKDVFFRDFEEELKKG
ncbi:MAG: response regulator [Desulfobacterales bacterium]|nr:response regulator [Desulfobacterales bacterium]